MLTIFIRLRDIVVLTSLSRTLRCLVLCLFFALSLIFAPSCSRHLSLSLKGEQVEFEFTENDSVRVSGIITRQSKQ